MALTASDIMTRARERYNATGDDFFSDQMLRALIFSAQEELAKEGWVIEKTYTTTSIANTRELTYPTNTLAIKDVKYDYKKLKKYTLAEDPKTDSSETTGKPFGYALWDSVIFLYPTPDTTGETIQIRTYAYPADLTQNNSALDVPDEYKENIINFVISHMALKDQNIQLASYYQNLWTQTVIKAVEQRRKMLRSDRPARVKDEYFGSDPTNYYEGFWDGWTL